MKERLDRALRFEGSTRAIALVRIGLVLQLWACWGSDFILTRLHDGRWLGLGAAFYVGTALMLVGWRTRLATAVTAIAGAGIFYVLGVWGGTERLAHHHCYVLVAATALLALTPAGGSFSVDRWLAVRRALAAGEDVPPERGPLWATYLLMAQVSAIYFWGALSKLSPSFFDGQRLLQILMVYASTSDVPRVPGLPIWLALSGTGTIALEFALAFGLWFHRPRRWLLPVGVAFHAVIYATLPVVTFSATMWLLYLLFVPPDDVHRIIDELTGAATRSPSRAPAAAPPASDLEA